MTTYRYYRWDGSQQVFNMDADDLMNSIADDILEHGDPERALRSLCSSAASTTTRDSTHQACATCSNACASSASSASSNSNATTSTR